LSRTTYIHTDTITQSAIKAQFSSLDIYESKPDTIISGLKAPYFRRYYVDSFCSGRFSLESSWRTGTGFIFSPLSHCWRVVPGISGFEQGSGVSIEGFGTRIYNYEMSGGNGTIDYSSHSIVSYAKIGGCGWGTKYNVLALGVSNEAKTVAFAIAPNPTNSSAIITSSASLQNAKLVVYNITGQKMFAQRLLGTTESIATDGLVSGLYFFEISDGVNKQVFKVTIQH
jgi:hypothetical protein